MRCAGVFKAARAAALAQVPGTVPARRRTFRLMPQLATLAATLAVAAVAIVVMRQTPACPPPATPAAQPAPLGPSGSARPPATPLIEKPAVVISSEQLLATRSDRNNTAYL